MTETRSFERKPRGGGSFRGGRGRGGFRGGRGGRGGKPFDRNGGGRGGNDVNGFFKRGGGGGDRRGGFQRGGRGGFKSSNWKGAVDRGLMPLPDDVENRLTKLRNSLNAKGTDPEEIKKILRTERRNAENDTKKNVKNACFRCRGFGHKLAECPQAKDDSMADVCYKCGSSEHKLFECKSKKSGLEFARCFICQKEGHIARSCPENSRGAYPRGGSCKVCDSVDHLAKDCPEENKNNGNSDDDEEDEEEEYTLDTMGDTTSADAQDFIPIKKEKKPKVVNF